MPSFVGGAQAKDVSSLHLPSSSSCRPLTLKFVDVSYRVKVTNKSGNTIGRIFGCGSGDGAAPPVQERSILHGVSGMVATV
ncbi:hypothetical protein SDJN02_13874 [Cucurbita argyrosperma subsp. argyrosperma]|nr:hypothetical protein SDJN02_13874 [Cucurbita argyrosperma subsp. argyrosperma]